MGLITNDRLTNYFYKEKFVLKLFGYLLLAMKVLRTGCMDTLLFFRQLLFILFWNLEIYSSTILILHAADALIYEICAFVGLAKTSVLLRYRLKFGKIMDQFDKEPLLLNLKRGGKTEEKLIKDCIWITSIQSLTYLGFAIISLTLAISYTLIRRIRSSDYHDWQFAYGPLTVLNVTYSPNFEISWLYQNFNFVVLASQFCTTDVLAAAVLAHISCQFRILQNYLGRFVENSYREMMKDKNGINSSLDENITMDEIDVSTIHWKYLKITLKDFVRYHIAATEIVEEVEEVFSGLLLLVFLGALGAICFDVYHASMMPLSDIRQARSAVEILNMSLQILTVCYWGEQVLSESQQVGRAAYEANFVGADLRFQKGIALIIRRSQCSSKLTAGKFADVALTTYAWVMRTAFSTFTILHKANTRET